MTERKKMYFPGTAESWGILGICIFSMLSFAPVNLLLDNLLGVEISFLVYYLLALGAPFAFAHFMRNKRSIIKDYDFSLSSIKITVLVSISMIALQTAIISPITNSIPMPEFMKEIFLDLANRKGVFSFMAIVIAAPVIEELIFRGIMLDGLLRRYSPRKSIVLSSVLFGLCHLNPWQFISATVVGLFSGWVYYKTRKLTLSITIHAVNNGVAFVGMLFMDVEKMMEKSLIEMYGGIFNAILITAVAFAASIIGLYLLRKEFHVGQTFEWKNTSGTEDHLIEQEI